MHGIAVVEMERHQWMRWEMYSYVSDIIDHMPSLGVDYQTAKLVVKLSIFLF